MKNTDEARALLGAAHTLMPAELIAAHAIELAGVVASQDALIEALCATIATLTFSQSQFVSVEASWPEVYGAGVLND